MSLRPNKKTLVIALIGGVLIASTYAFSPAPVPVVLGEHENNLKVLPKDISHDDLMNVMHSFEVALNYNCGDCHTHSASDSTKMDFGADTDNKSAALSMMKMVQEINGTYFNVKGDFAQNYLASEYKVSCNSCHNGHEKPARQVSIPIPKKR